MQVIGRHTAVFVPDRTLRNTVLCAIAAAGCAAAYAGITGRSPVDVASSGQATLGQLASDPQAWSVGALVAVLAFKSVACAADRQPQRGGAGRGHARRHRRHQPEPRQRREQRPRRPAQEQGREDRTAAQAAQAGSRWSCSPPWWPS